MKSKRGISADIAKRIKPSYYENYYGKGVGLTSENAYWEAEEFICRLTMFIDKVNPTFLDLGAGTGAIVKLMRDIGLEADGYELNEYALRNAEVDVIRQDVTEPFLKKYDIVYSNVFMYFSNKDFENFFRNNRELFNVLVLVYPFEGNEDEYRVGLRKREEFNRLSEEHRLMMFEDSEGWIVLIREEDVCDLPYR